jgi:HSP20 family molecular chaperone IbpA
MSIFNYFDRQMRSMLWDWDIDREFNLDADDLNAEWDEKALNEGKGYSLSYRYETGMEEPEITIKGDVDEQIVTKFVKSAEKTFGQRFKGLEDKARLLLGSKKEDGQNIEDIKEKSFTLEMPGLGQDDIKVEIKDKKATIIGEKGDLKYKKTLRIPFEPKNHEITADNGLISIKLLKE